VSCSFNPDTVTPGASGARSTMTIATTSSSLVPPTGDGPQDDAFRWPQPAMPSPPRLWWFAAVALLATAARMRKYRPAFLVVGVVVAVGIGQTLNRASAAAPASAIAIFPGTLTFGSQTVSTTAPAQLVKVSNTGADPLTLTVSVNGDFSQTSTCSTLASSETCTVAVTFTPTTTGTRSGSLSFLDNAPGSPHTVTLTGTGAAPPASGSGTPAGTYTVTVTGTAGTLSHTSPITLTVQ